MAQYATKYTASLRSADGKEVTLRIKQKGWQGDNYGIATPTGMSLEIQGASATAYEPIIKTSCALSVRDARDVGTTTADGTTCVKNGEKWGRWEEFYTPDPTKYLVELDGDSFSWQGYITPDSYGEDLQYRGVIRIVARDMLGALDNAEFNLAGRVSVAQVLNEAFSVGQIPMPLTIRRDRMLYNSNGESIADAQFYAQTFAGKSWGATLEEMLEALGLCLRYNGVEFECLAVRYAGALDAAGQSDSAEFVSGSGYRTIDPALKQIVETFDIETFDIETPDATAFSGSHTLTARYTKGDGTTVDATVTTQDATLPLGATAGWFGDSMLPIPASKGILNGSIGAHKHMFATDLVNPAFTAEMKNEAISTPCSLTIEDEGVWDNASTLFLKRVDRKVSKVTVSLYCTLHGNTWVYDGDIWDSTTAQKQSFPTIDLIPGTARFIPQATYAQENGEDYRIIIRAIKTEGNIATTVDKLYALLSVKVEPTASDIAKEYKTTTIYNAENNREIKRTPALGSISTQYGGASVANVLLYGGAIATNEWKWAGMSQGYPLAVMIHAQIIQHYAYASSVFSGTTTNNTRMAMPHQGFPVYEPMGAESQLLGGTYNFVSGFIDSVKMRELHTWAQVWGTSFNPQYTVRTSNLEGGTASAGGGKSPAGGGGTGGGGGVTAFDDLTGRPKYNGAVMTSETDIPVVPTKVSQLQNDSGYITAAALLPYRTASAQDAIDADILDTIPTTLAELSGDSTHRVVTDSQISAWNAKYSKPSTGIPLNDLANGVQTTLSHADSLWSWFGIDASGNIYVKDGRNFYTEGEITAGGIGSGGGSGATHLYMLADVPDYRTLYRGKYLRVKSDGSGTEWVDIQGGASSFAQLDGSPYDNTALATALNSKWGTPTNASVLLGITSAKVTAWDGAASKAHEHANKTSVLDKLKWDATNNAIYIGDSDHPINFYTFGELTAGGVGSGGGQGGGLASVYFNGNRVDNGERASFGIRVNGTAPTPDASGYINISTTSGTITGAMMNGSPVQVSSGILQLGTVITSLSGYRTATAQDAIDDILAKRVQSLQSQVDSLAAKTDFDEIIATTLFADTLTASNAVFGLVNGLDLNAKATAWDAKWNTPSNASVLLGITSAKVTGWDGAYAHISNTSNPHNVTWSQVKPSGGVPLADLASGVQTSLGKADISVPNTRKVNGHALSADVTITKGDVGLGSVENTRLSTWEGTDSITTLGTITTGVWHGTAIAMGYLADDVQISLGKADTAYQKPSTGIPYADLSSGVKGSLDKADSALQSHQSVTLVSGTNNGTLKLTTNAGTVDNIAVKGLAALAYKASLAFSDLTSHPTTISGYGITDAYTGAQVDAKEITGVSLTTTKLTLTKTNGNLEANIPTWNQSTTGNAATATQLATARTLWGQSFNGAANVDGDMSSVGKMTFTAKASAATSGNVLEVVTLNGVTYLHTTLPFYSDSEITAGGVGSGSGGGGLIETVYGYTDLGGTYSDADKTDTFNAYTTARLAQRITALENAPAGGVTSFNGRTGAVSLTASDVNAVISYITASDLSPIENAIKSLQSQVDSVSARDGFDELTATAVFADILVGTNIYGTFHGDADTVNGHTVNSDVPAGAIFTDTHDTNVASTGISVSGTRGNTIAINATYQTYISHGETAYNDQTIVSQALQSLQSQIDGVASKWDYDELLATSLYADILSAGRIYASDSIYVGSNVVYHAGNLTKSTLGLGNVENKSSATIRSEITASDIPTLDASKITTGQFADARIASAGAWNAKWDYDANTIKAVKVNNAGNADTLGGYSASYFQPLASAINTGNIGSQSVAYADDAGYADYAESAGDSDTLEGHSASYFQPLATAINTSNYTTYCATAAQGQKADNALPKTGGTVTGAITFAANDSYGIFTATDNYGSIGALGTRFYRAYINNIYGTTIYESNTALSDKYHPKGGTSSLDFVAGNITTHGNILCNASTQNIGSSAKPWGAIYANKWYPDANNMNNYIEYTNGGFLIHGNVAATGEVAAGA